MSACHAIEEGIKTYLNKEAIKESSPYWEGYYQKRVEEIAKYFFESIQKSEAGHFYKMACCVRGTKLEVDALRVALVQGFHIVASAFPKNVEEEIPATYAGGAVTKRIIPHQCSEKIEDLSKSFNWNSPANKQECWQLYFNWYADNEGRILVQPQQYALIPLGKIPAKIDDYVDKLIRHDAVIGKFSYLVSVLVYRRLQMFADIIMSNLSDSAGKQEDDKIVLEGYVKGSPTEIELLVHFLSRERGVHVLPSVMNITMAPTEPVYFLTEMLGMFHPGNKNEYYMLERLKSLTISPEPSTRENLSLARWRG